jgi:hypothetical protein
MVVHVVIVAAPVAGSACRTVGSAFPWVFGVGVRQGRQFPVLEAVAGAPQQQRLRARSLCCTHTALYGRCSATVVGGVFR